jgi:hypothetical protein
VAEIDMDARYKVAGWPGVAVRIHGWPRKWVPCLCLCVDDDGNEYEEECGDGDWEDDVGDRIIVVMVGDDAKHTVSVDDLTPIGELDYCHECGQIGCGHDGIVRDDD